MRAIIIEEDRFSEVTTLMREAASNDLGNRRASFGASVLTDGLAGKRTE